MLHRLPLSQGTLHGYFSRDLEPALTIAPGDSVRFAVPNSSWYVEPEHKFGPRDPTLDVGHALVGPISVRGARVGQTLVVRIDLNTASPCLHGSGTGTASADRGRACDADGLTVATAPAASRDSVGAVAQELGRMHS